MMNQMKMTSDLKSIPCLYDDRMHLVVYDIERDDFLRKTAVFCLMLIILCLKLSFNLTLLSRWCFHGLKTQGILLADEISSKLQHGVDVVHPPQVNSVILGGSLKQ